MRFFRKSCRFLCLPLAVLMLLVSVPLSSVHAALVTTEQVVGDDGGMTADREKVIRFLQLDAVRDQLASLGVDPAEVEARLTALSDAEIAQIAGTIDEMPAGQGTVGIVVGAALIVFLVLLITDIAGITDIFPFVKKNN